MLRRSMMKPFSLSAGIWAVRSVIAFFSAVGGLLVELRQLDVGDVVALHVRAHRAHADDVAGDRDFDRLVRALAHHAQLDLGVDRSTHLFDGLVQGQALHRFVVEMGDDVVGQDAGLGGGRLVDRRHHLHEAVFHRDFDAETAEFAAGLHLHVTEALGVHVARMRIEAGQHAVDRGFDQLGVVGPLDIVGAHALEHVAEQIEVAIGVGRRRSLRAHAGKHDARLHRDQSERCACGGTQEYEECLAHHPRTFSLSFWPTTGRNRRVSRPFEIRRKAPAGWSPLGRGGRHLRRAAPHHCDGLAGQHELTDIDGNPIHPREDDMIPAAGIQDQELPVGAERSGIDHPAVAGSGHLGARPWWRPKCRVPMPPRPSAAPKSRILTPLTGIGSAPRAERKGDRRRQPAGIVEGRQSGSGSRPFDRGAGTVRRGAGGVVEALLPAARPDRAGLSTCRASSPA